MTPQIAPSNAGSAALRDRKLKGPVTLRNLLRFSARADDGHAPHHAPDIPVIGRDACARYEAGIAPRRAAADGEFVFSGRAGAWLPGSSARRTRIGAPLLRQASVARFLAF